MSILAQDTFGNRTISPNTSGNWGNASDGNPWTQLGGIYFESFAVTAGEGRINSGITDTIMLLGSGSTTDQEGLVRLALGQNGDSIGIVLRCNNTGDTCYYCEIGGFTDDLTIRRVIGGTKTTLNIWSTGLTIFNNAFYWLRFQVIGTRLKARIWADGNTEPTTWRAAISDNSIASGQYGLFCNSFSTINSQFDSYQANDNDAGGGGPGSVLPITVVTPMPVISWQMPAYTNDDFGGAYPASNANGGLYGRPHQWRTQTAVVGNADSGPLTQAVYVAYDLSTVHMEQRQNVVVVWYNDPTTDPYDSSLINVNYYNVPADYTIDTNTAAGGSLPSSGWTTQATVTGNPYHSRQHAFNLAGAAWIRIRVTAIKGSTLNNNVQLTMDVHDVHAGNVDNWIFFGDSIGQLGLDHDDVNISTVLAEQVGTYVINTPLMENAGVGGFSAADGVAHMSTWLPLFSGHYVGLNYGTNDANDAPGGTLVQAYFANMSTMIDMVIHAGKIPVMYQTIPYGLTSNILANGPTINTTIQALKHAYPQLILGPDLWSYYQGHQDLISDDNIHPTLYDGYVAFREQWANALLIEVYTPPPPQFVPDALVLSSQQQSLYLSGGGLGLPIRQVAPVYQVGASPLPNQPYLATAPMVAGQGIPAGSPFTLLFSNPSNATKNALPDGSLVTFSFGLVDRQVARGQVRVRSTFTGGVFQVNCTTVANISLVAPPMSESLPGPPQVAPLPSASTNLYLGGIGMGTPATVPIRTVYPIYAIDDTLLANQPYLATAPAYAGATLSAGSLFTLFFQSPSADTQAALTNGAIIPSFTFTFASGQKVTGSIRVRSVLTGTIFLVECILTQNILM